jgi:hypothetical protein
MRTNLTTTMRSAGPYPNLTAPAMAEAKTRLGNASVVAQKFVEKVQMMAVAKVELKSPFFPFFSKGEFSECDHNPSLEKRGRGDFFSDRLIEEFCSELLSQYTSFAIRMLRSRSA